MEMNEYYKVMKKMDLKELKTLVHEIEVDEDLNNISKKKLISRCNRYMRKWRVNNGFKK